MLERIQKRATHNKTIWKGRNDTGMTKKVFSHWWSPHDIMKVQCRYCDTMGNTDLRYEVVRESYSCNVKFRNLILVDEERPVWKRQTPWNPKGITNIENFPLQGQNLKMSAFIAMIENKTSAAIWPSSLKTVWRPNPFSVTLKNKNYIISLVGN